MKRRLFIAGLISILMIGCSPLERQAYNIVVGSKAALVKYRSNHPECGTFDAVTGMSAATKIYECSLNNRLTAAKDLVIDAAEIYCSGKDFENGGACNPPSKNSPGYQQAVDKLRSAIASYESVERDFNNAVKGAKQ